MNGLEDPYLAHMVAPVPHATFRHMLRSALALALAVLAGVKVTEAATSTGDVARESIPRDSVLWQFDTGG